MLIMPYINCLHTMHIFQYSFVYFLNQASNTLSRGENPASVHRGAHKNKGGRKREEAQSAHATLKILIFLTVHVIVLLYLDHRDVRYA